LGLNGIIDPSCVVDYLAWGGYRAFYQAVRYFSHEEIINQVEQVGLIGRSGSAFPAVEKWKKALSFNSDKRYVICNADESDPGAYMHRVLMEGNPHLVIEGLMLTAYAIGANEAIIYTRSRYEKAVERLLIAVEQLKAIGMLGQDILGSGFSLDLQVRKGPGAYVCGEETALIASIEGKRGMPRPKPPFPVEIGLFGYPTVVHNVETLAQVPFILNQGPNEYKKLGTQTCSGTKLFSLSGKFNYHGVLELPFGYGLGDLIRENAQGTQNKLEPKAILAGGPSGKFVVPELFDTALDFHTFKEKGLTLGSGSLILLDEKSCPIDLVGHLMRFIQNESCGKCIPCREGTKRMSQILDMVIQHPGQDTQHQTLHRFKGVTELHHLAQVIKDTSLCGLGKGASNPLLSVLTHFREEFEDHVFERICPSGVCQDLRSFHIDSEACTGCYICFSKCPEQAIIGSPRQTHVIVSERCTGCGICQEVCKFNAVMVR